MTVIDYNGIANWSVEAVQRRYRIYACENGLNSLRNVNPRIHRKDDTLWIYPVMEEIIAGIEANDLACVEIGIEFIAERAAFPLG